jgi:hypothetical protein
MVPKKSMHTARYAYNVDAYIAVSLYTARKVGLDGHIQVHIGCAIRFKLVRAPPSELLTKHKYFSDFMLPPSLIPDQAHHTC